MCDIAASPNQNGTETVRRSVLCAPCKGYGLWIMRRRKAPRIMDYGLCVAGKRPGLWIMDYGPREGGPDYGLWIMRREEAARIMDYGLWIAH